MSDEQKILVEIYRAYSDAKEKFIDRNFATNRYYLGLIIILLLLALIFYALTPSLFLIAMVGAIGLVVSILWWLNLDSYQFAIKIKYASVLEKMEEKLPARPCQDEFKASQEAKQKKNAIVFPDLQKGFAGFFIFIFVVIFGYGTIKIFKNNFYVEEKPTVQVQTQQTPIVDLELEE